MRLISMTQPVTRLRLIDKAAPFPLELDISSLIKLTSLFRSINTNLFFCF